MIASLQDAIVRLQQQGAIQSVSVSVDPLLELATIVRRVCGQPAGGAAVLFEQPSGYQMPVLANLFGSAERMQVLLEVAGLEQITGRFGSLLDRLKNFDLEQMGGRLDRLLEQDGFRPQLVSAAPCQQQINDAPDLLALPFHQNWPDDGTAAGTGRYITLGQVHTAAPDGTDPNCGIYRCQIHDGQTLAVRWRAGSGAGRHHQQYQRLQQRMPVAISLGGPPALTLAAAWPLPDGLDELTFAGWLAASPIPVVCCGHGLLRVPAEAELVLEGYAEPDQQLVEGPFGNHTGCYDPAGLAARVTITRITSRKQPILPITVVGPAPQEDNWMMLGWECLLAALLPRLVPGVVALNLPLPWVFRQSAVLALDRQRVSDLQQLVAQLWQLPWFRSARLLVCVDAETALHDPFAVAWQVVYQGAWDRLLRSDDQQRLVLDATGWHTQGVVLENRTMDRLVADRWSVYGMTKD